MYKTWRNTKIFFNYFLFMQGHPCKTKLKRNEFLLLKFMISFFFLLFYHHTLTLKFMISFFFLLFFIIHWLWNSWFPFSFCFSSSYIDFEIHDFLAWRQNITISGISKMWCFSKVQKSQEIWRILFRFRQSPVLLTVQKCHD